MKKIRAPLRPIDEEIKSVPENLTAIFPGMSLIPLPSLHHIVSFANKQACKHYVCNPTSCLRVQNLRSMIIEKSRYQIKESWMLHPWGDNLFDIIKFPQALFQKNYHSFINIPDNDDFF